MTTTTTDTEISDILNDEIKHFLSSRSKKQYCTEVKIRAHLLELCSIQNNARGKTMNRYVAENSLRSAFPTILLLY